MKSKSFGVLSSNSLNFILQHRPITLKEAKKKQRREQRKMKKTTKFSLFDRPFLLNFGSAAVRQESLFLQQPKI